MNKIDEFISELSKSEKTFNATNLYYGNSIESQIRKHNLKVYLNQMKRLNPKVLLLGEAPGYKGCRLTGLAFTSERIICENKFFDKEEFRFINNSDKLESEISATIVWSQISEIKDKPLIWNIFPFHPHRENDVNSNRTPRKGELEEGLCYLKLLLKGFGIKQIVALGRKPEKTLLKNGIDCKYVRHPANGGKNKFIDSLNVLLT